MGNVYRILVGEFERKEPFWRLGDRWKDHINARGLNSCGPGLEQVAGGLLFSRYETFGYHKRRSVSWPAQPLLIISQGLSFMTLINAQDCVCPLHYISWCVINHHARRYITLLFLRRWKNETICSPARQLRQISCLYMGTCKMFSGNVVQGKRPSTAVNHEPRRL
jgi:hypothetical protein